MVVKGALPFAIKFESGVLIYFSALLFQLVSKSLPALQLCFHDQLYNILDALMVRKGL